MSSGSYLPAGWVEAALPDVAEVNPPDPSEPPAGHGLVSFVPMAAVEAGSGRLDASDVRPWSHVRKGYTRFQDGDVLFAKITPCMENGKAAVARGLSNGVGAGSTEFHVLRPTDAVRAELLLYYVLQEEFRKSARAQMTGTAGQLRVPGRFLDAQRVPLPPVPEQRRIVSAIESYFTRLDDAVATLERVQRNLKRYRASVLKAAVEGRLVPTEAALARAEGRSYEPASVLLTRILAERRRRWEEAELAKLTARGKAPKDDKWKSKYLEPVAPDTSGLPELPEGWCWSTVEQLSSRLQYGHTASAVVRHQGVRFLRITDVQNGTVDWRSVPSCEIAQGEIDSYLLRASDIVVARTGATVGKSFRLRDPFPRSIFASYLIRLESVSPELSGWLEVFLDSPDYWQQVRRAQVGTGQPNVNASRLSEIVLPLPPFAEQLGISLEVARLFSTGEEAATAAETSLRRLARLRQSILKWAFEGRLVDQDPTDEPASVLLERIRAECAAAAERQSPKRRRQVTRP